MLIRVFLDLFVGAISIWVIWSNWWVLRNRAALFCQESSPYDKPSIRDSAAFLGFWVTLFLAIFLPLQGFLSLILPSTWGWYSTENDKWSSLAERIAIFSGIFGSFGVMYRMSKIRRSVLDPEFWSKRFRPREVDECLSALEQIGPLFEHVLNVDCVLDRVRSGIQSENGRKALIHVIRSTDNSPRDVVLHAIVQVSKSQLSSGQFHVYRGVLSMQGSGVRSALGIALNQLVKSGFMSEAQANRERAEIEQAIKLVG